MLLLLTAVGALPYVMAMAVMVLLWHGLRAAGVALRREVLIPLILLILSPALTTPGVLLQAFLFPTLSADIVRFWLPLFSGVLIGLTVFQALRGAGLGWMKAAWFGVGAAMALLVAFGAQILMNAYVVGSHAFG